MPAKLFLDTNIIFDVIDVSRPNSDNVRRLLLSGEDNGLTFLISAITVNTIVYVMQQKFKLKANLLKEKLFLLFDLIEVVAFDYHAIAGGLELDFDDLEDSFQFASALECGADVLVTEDKLFLAKGTDGSSLKILSTSEAISILKL
jgi:predicted nucleic acid-binding protein